MEVLFGRKTSPPMRSDAVIAAQEMESMLDLLAGETFSSANPLTESHYNNISPKGISLSYFRLGALLQKEVMKRYVCGYLNDINVCDFVLFRVKSQSLLHFWKSQLH